MNFKVPDIFKNNDERNQLINKIREIPCVRNCSNCEFYLDGICIDCNAKIPDNIKEKTCKKYKEYNCPF